MKGQILHLVTIMLWSAPTLTLCASSNEEAPNYIYRFLADNTFYLRKFACTEQENRCFKEKKLLSEEDGKCYVVGEIGPCAAGKIFHADKEEASRQGGHLRGTCENLCASADQLPLAATGECMTRNEVENTICRSDWYLRAALDVFGQWVCEWTTLVCSPPQRPVNSFILDSPFNGICFAPDIYIAANEFEEKVAVDIPFNHPLLRYFAYHIFSELEFPCTEAEEACLKYGRLLHSNGNCYELFDATPQCDFLETLHLDWDEAMKEKGTLRGTCRKSCVEYRDSLIEREKCVDYSPIITKVCRQEWGMEETNGLFGQRICRCSRRPPVTPTLPPPASAFGYCRVPDFFNPVRSPGIDMSLELGFNLPCSEEEFECLQKNLVLLEGACHALRTKGPCAENEEVVLDKEALAHARLQAKCQGPCPAGTLRMPIDGNCFTPEQAKSSICPTKLISLDAFGGWQCDFKMDLPTDFSTIVRYPNNGTCELPENLFAGGGGGIGGGGWGTGGNTGGKR